MPLTRQQIQEAPIGTKIRFKCTDKYHQDWARIGYILDNTWLVLVKTDTYKLRLPVDPDRTFFWPIEQPGEWWIEAHWYKRKLGEYQP